jgi:hypothetical protein
MSDIVVSNTGMVKTAEIVPSARLVASIAMTPGLAPRLDPSMTTTQWLAMTSDIIGKHPGTVLCDALDSIVSTKTFPPSSAEIVDAILHSYRTMKVELSPDGKRHLAYRSKLDNKRYIMRDDGTAKYQDGEKVSLIGYINVFGAQANLIIEKTPHADAFDFERTIADVVKSFASTDKDDITANTVMSRFESYLTVTVTHRVKGKPSGHCGGHVADGPTYRFQPTKMESSYLALSELFVNNMRSLYPDVKHPSNHRSWIDGMYYVFMNVACQLDPKNYGTPEFQEMAEAIIENKMAERNGDGKRLREFESKSINKSLVVKMNLIVSALAKLAIGGVVTDKVEIDGVKYQLSTIDGCHTVKEKIQKLRGDF